MTPAAGRRGGTGPEEGIVLVWMAMLLVVLLGVAALVVDIGYWIVAGHREQKAADAAALAAAIYWPNSPGQATAEARSTAARNGYDPALVTVAEGSRPTFVKVSVTTTVPGFFAGVFGVTQRSLTRTASAEYQGPVPMGSPAKGFGNEPVQGTEARWSNLYSSPSDQPQFWANVVGPRSPKRNGDADQSKVCTAANADACTGTSAPPGMNTANDDYRTGGYVYQVSVSDPPLSAGAHHLAIEAFDPAFVNVGDTCTLANLDVDADQAVYDPGGSPYRYQSGPASTFCTGDQLFPTDRDPAILPLTTFVIRRPDTTPWNNFDNPPIENSVTCDSRQLQFPGYNASIKSLLDANPGDSASGGNTGGARFRSYFRKWYRLCSIPVGLVPAGGGDYIVQIRTNAPLYSPYGASRDEGAGANRFSLRASWVRQDGTPVSGNSVSISAADSMSIYANAAGADTRFFLARVFPGADGRILDLRFFDTGDAALPGNLTVLPPAEYASSFSGCTVTRESMAQVNAPVTGCTVTALSSATDNGKWIRVRVPIPSGYTCDTSSPTGCWVKVRFTYPVGTRVTDTTTWSARILGDPVRLVG